MRTLHHDLPPRLSRDGRTGALRYKRPDTGHQVYLSDLDEPRAIAFATVLNAAFGARPPRGMRQIYRQQFLSFEWGKVEREFAALAAVKLPDVMPMQRGLVEQEEIRHSWAYQPPGQKALRHGLGPVNTRRKAWVITLFKAAKKNAAARRIAFDLNQEDVERMVVESGGRCAVTGIALSLDRGELPEGRRMRRPWAPSIDRLDSSAGYTPANCRIVCCAANYAMSQWGEEVLVEMAKAIARKRITRMDRVVAG